MKTLGTFVVGALFAALVAAPASAQQPGASPDPHHPESPAGTSPAPPSAPTPGMKSASMPMMDMCRQMMAGMTGMPMMGGAAPADPKEKADMLQLRGEMMKAMGEVMMNHARRMQGTQAK